MAEGASLIDTVVIGAGQCGLGVSYFLGQAGVPHRVLERRRIGERWRTQRWDSFRMNTPNAVTVMPDSPYEGGEPQGFMTSDEFLARLEAFAAGHALPVETESPVLDLGRDEDTALYRLETPREVILARNVVLAGGGENRPRLPALAGSLPGSVRELHSAEYRNPAALPAGAVLVVGSASSGIQITDDLLDAGRKVYLATCRITRVPRRHRGRDMILWRFESGFLDQPPEAAVPAPRLQLAASRMLSLQSVSARGAVLLGRLTGVEGPRLTFGDDLEENIRVGEEGARAARAQVDDYIARSGIEAPPAAADPAEAAVAQLPDPPIRSLDLAGAGIGSVIWCTGFGADLSWVRLPVLDARGAPVHVRGVSTTCPGVFFIGLPWLSARKSALVVGVADDARRIAGLVAARR
jgi:putative flavoprotein involved in K+ transport